MAPVATGSQSATPSAPSADIRADLLTIRTLSSSLLTSLSPLLASSASSDGLPLLSIKAHSLASYLHHITLLLGLRLSRSSLQARGAAEPQAGDVVDELIRLRVVLEKVRGLQGKMRYRIEKLVKAAEEGEGAAAPAKRDVGDDPLAFKPNPQNFAPARAGAGGRDAADESGDEDAEAQEDGVYRPPKLAPMAYNESSSKKGKDKKSLAPTSLLPDLLLHTSNPYTTSSTGLSTHAPAQSSARARELARMTAYEEENFTRLVMKKRDSRRRAQDEADLALGGSGSVGKGRRAIGGLHSEFDDVLRAVEGGGKRGGRAEVWEEMRRMGKRGGALERGKRSREERSAAGGGEEEGAGEEGRRKKGRFERQVSEMGRKKAGKGKGKRK